MDTSNLIALLNRALIREPSKGAGRAAVPVAWATTRGQTRKENQDRLLIGRASTGLFLAVLADGMGGMKEGGRAATLTAAAIAAHCFTVEERSTEALLHYALVAANEEVFRALQGEGGAAVVVAVSGPDGAYVAHAGDARAYALTADGLPVPLTVDDTVRAQMEQMGRSTDLSSASNHQLLQFVGFGRGFEPHVVRVPAGSRGLLLTSDGAHSIPLPVLQWIAAGAGHLQLLAERIVISSEWHGGKDNATVLAVGLHNGHLEQPEPTIEFWLPNDHLIVVASQTHSPVAHHTESSPSKAASSPVTPEREQSRQRSSKRPRSRKRPVDTRKKGRTKRQEERLPLAETGARPLPIVTFDDAPDPLRANAAPGDKIERAALQPEERVSEDEER